MSTKIRILIENSKTSNEMLKRKKNIFLNINFLHVFIKNIFQKACIFEKNVVILQSRFQWGLVFRGWKCLVFTGCFRVLREFWIVVL